MCIFREEHVVEVHSEGRGPEAETHWLAWCLCKCMEANMADMHEVCGSGGEGEVMWCDGSPCKP